MIALVRESVEFRAFVAWDEKSNTGDFHKLLLLSREKPSLRQTSRFRPELASQTYYQRARLPDL